MDAADLVGVSTYLNTAHPDTLLFLANSLTADTADSARLVHVTNDCCDLEVVTGEGSATHRLAFAASQATLDGIRGEVFGFVRRARAATSPETPLTSLEHIVADTERETDRVAIVAGRRSISPGLVEITFTDPNGFTSLGGDEYLKLSADGSSAFYTVRRHRADVSEFDIWVVLHTGGPMSRWADTATVGAEVIIGAQRRTFAPPADTTHIVAFGDASGLAAIARIISETSPAISLTAVVSVDATTASRTLTPSATTSVRVVSDTTPGATFRILEGLDAVHGEEFVRPHVEIGPTTYVFGAGEASEMASVRSYLRRDRGLSPDWCCVHGYWARDNADAAANSS
ncbi:MAG: siderophore-interacting protein [Ilumatobacter sp.]|uniref:siderophore-interacting protein n=1 Tax=Ilumatobacter sp. TaxID=1967498 RepID=UPI00391D1AB2